MITRPKPSARVMTTIPSAAFARDVPGRNVLRSFSKYAKGRTRYQMLLIRSTHWIRTYLIPCFLRFSIDMLACLPWPDKSIGSYRTASWVREVDVIVVGAEGIALALGVGRVKNGGSSLSYLTMLLGGLVSFLRITELVTGRTSTAVTVW